MQRMVFNLSVFVMGATGYSIIELLWRGYTHWSMALTGGVCLILILETERKMDTTNVVYKSVFCGFVITGVEFIVGLIVNICLGLNVWDYSAETFNYLGQVCLVYTALWCLLCIPVFWATKGILKTTEILHEKINEKFFKNPIDK